jgi:hypothetical protein
MFGLTVLPRNFPVVTEGDTAQVAASANGSSFSDTDVSIGTAHARRKITVALAWTNTSDTLISIATGGVANDIHLQQEMGTTSVALASALVPTGETATIAMAFSGAVTMRFYRVNRGLSFRNTAAFDSQKVGIAATSASVSVRVPPLGHAYAVAGAQGAFTSWDAPANTRSINGPNETLFTAFADYNNPTRQFVNVTFKVNKSASGDIALVAASFGGDN